MDLNQSKYLSFLILLRTDLGLVCPEAKSVRKLLMPLSFGPVLGEISLNPALLGVFKELNNPEQKICLMIMMRMLSAGDPRLEHLKTLV